MREITSRDKERGDKKKKITGRKHGDEQVVALFNTKYIMSSLQVMISKTREAFQSKAQAAYPIFAFVVGALGHQRDDIIRAAILRGFQQLVSFKQ